MRLPGHVVVLYMFHYSDSHVNYICTFIQTRSSQQPYDVRSSCSLPSLSWIFLAFCSPQAFPFPPDPDYLIYWMFGMIDMHKEKPVALTPIPSCLQYNQASVGCYDISCSDSETVSGSFSPLRKGLTTFNNMFKHCHKKRNFNAWSFC